MKTRFCNTVKPCTWLGAIATALCAGAASATEPCGDYGACKTLVEVNSSDGDIGFHFLGDGAELRVSKLFNPRWKKIFSARARRELGQQTFTELFVESAEPLCFNPLTDDDPDNDDEDFTTLEEFVHRWMPGRYTFIGYDADWKRQVGRTVLGFDLPAAPQNLAYSGGVITWEPGDDLGRCADRDRLRRLVHAGKLPEHPRDVAVAAWEIVLEPDLEDGDPAGDEKFSVRISGDAESLAISVPLEYLAALPEDTPAKLEIGAIGKEDNATFTEFDGICLNEEEGCEDDEEE